MSTIARRVALLARPGTACDRLRGALADAGAELVLEADPLTLDPATLEAAGAQVVLVALDTQTEEALDRFESALQNPAIEVIFEEAELAARREGWEAARWVRHLAAKLHRHGDVLPPGSGPATAAAANDGAERSAAMDPVLEFAVDAEAETAPAADGMPAPAPEAAITMHEFDPLFGEITLDEVSTSTFTSAGRGDDLAADDTASAFDPSLNFSYDGDYDSLSTEPSTDAVAAAETGFFGVDEGAEFGMAEAPPASPDRGAPTDSNDPGFDAMFGDFGDFAAVDPGDAQAAGSIAPAADGAGEEAGEPTAASGKRVLELVSTDDGVGLQGGADAIAAGLEADQRFRHDLASLESRIAGMELVDDRILKGPAQANGAVLVMAGIGGPDAVRQLLGALPEDFPRPVLVQQRLDGGRYDKLVAQMQRATAMLVKLAEPGLPAIAGVIYILPAGICIKVSDAGITFIDGGDDVLAALPSADSAMLMLSGSDPALVDAVMTHSWAGALVIGQAPDGCYDAAAPNALLARGGGSGQPAELAERLSERWRS